MTATDISKRIAQEWPRFFVGAFAIWGLIGGIQSLWLGISLNSFVNNRKVLGGAFSFHRQGDLMGPEEEDRIVKATLIIVGSFITLTNGIALYGAIRKSIIATKTSFIVWIVQMSWLAVVIVVMFIGFFGMSDRDREGIPGPSVMDVAKLAGSFGCALFEGWSLFVYLRDLKNRPRNAWGFLVSRDQGVFEYEPVGTSSGPVHL